MGRGPKSAARAEGDHGRADGWRIALSESVPIPAGTPAPDLTLPSSSGASFTLSAHRGAPVVLTIYNKDDTPSCNRQVCEFADLFGELAGLGAVVAAISADSIRSHAKFSAKFGFPFPLLSDPDHAVAKQYGAWQPKVLYGREYTGIVRSTIVISPEGLVVGSYANTRSSGHAAFARSLLG